MAWSDPFVVRIPPFQLFQGYPTQTLDESSFNLKYGTISYKGDTENELNIIVIKKYIFSLLGHTWPISIAGLIEEPRSITISAVLV
jgi:hypothetical protein